MFVSACTCIYYPSARPQTDVFFVHIVCDTYLCDHCVGTPCCGINDVVVVAVKIIARGVSVAPSGDPEIHKIEPGFFCDVVHHISIANLPILG